MFFETLTWRQITDLFYKSKKTKKNIKTVWADTVRKYRWSWTLPFRLNLHVCKQRNWVEIKAQSFWGSCWLSQRNEGCLSAAVRLPDAVMRGAGAQSSSAAKTLRLARLRPEDFKPILMQVFSFLRKKISDHVLIVKIFSVNARSVPTAGLQSIR